MRARGIALATGTMALGLVLGAMMSPPPADAVAKEIIQLQQQVAELMQSQQNMQTAMTSNFATLKTLLEQNVDSQNQVTSAMGSLEKSIQTAQANNGSAISSLSSQVQALSDSLEDVKARIGKLSAQLGTAESSLQSLSAQVATCTSGAQPQQQPQQPGAAAGDNAMPPGAAAPTAPGASGASSPTAANTAPAQWPATPPAPADLLYTNGLRDITSANYDLANQEFQEYLHYYPNTDLASNAHFYLGEIAYAEGRYPNAIAEYNLVLNNFPDSFKRADARLKKAYALLKLHENSSAVTELRMVIRENPGTEQARKAEAQLRQLGVRTR